MPIRKSILLFAASSSLNILSIIAMWLRPLPLMFCTIKVIPSPVAPLMVCAHLALVNVLVRASLNLLIDLRSRSVASSDSTKLCSRNHSSLSLCVIFLHWLLVKSSLTVELFPVSTDFACASDISSSLGSYVSIISALRVVSSRICLRLLSLHSVVSFGWCSVRVAAVSSSILWFYRVVV